MQEFPKLYKPDSKGVIRCWGVSVNGKDVTITYGVDGGKILTKTDRVSGKNIGRANETSAEEQAIRVAEAKWKHQRDRKGYGETPEDAVVAKLPMLAQDFKKSGHRITFPCMVQPKFDGIRAIIHKIADGDVRITSRTGKVFGADLSHIEIALDQSLEAGAVLDGELYIHGDALEEISSAAQKSSERTLQLGFFVFDIVYPSMPNSQRAWLLENSFAPRPPIYLAKTYTVKTFEDVKRFHDKCCEMGFEGVMLRNLNGQYRYNYRSADLQKYKEMLDKEFPILNVEEDKDGNALFTLSSEGGEFKCVLVGNKEENRKYLADDSLWKAHQMTVQYQKIYPKTGLPQFPIGKAVRTYE